MIRVKIPILEVMEGDVITNLQNNPENNIVTEAGCKSAVENYASSDVTLVTLGKLPTGEVVGLEYDEVKKVLVAEVELYMDFAATVGIFKHLETPQGKRLVNFKVGGVQASIDIEKLKKNVEAKLPKAEGDNHAIS